MTMQENKRVEQIRAEYLPTKTNGVDELKKLDRKVKRPAEIFAYTFGVVGALTLGTGMCLAMKVIGNMLRLGVGIGVVGIAMVSANYFLYKRFLQSRKNKYAEQILSLSERLLKE